ncbi:MAG: hypothetical protein MUC68_03990 [Burkholderiaceae bacterium]|jgi:hypothetical protein|nr:hypothetical protein [Burkholderiaceae bacterium]
MRTRRTVLPRLLALTALAAASAARAAAPPAAARPNHAPPRSAPPVGASLLFPTERTPGRDVYRIAFEGHTPAEVSIAGNGQSDLTLHVFRGDGVAVCEDTAAGDRKTCRWTPAATAEFVIEVRNAGARGNDYLFWTN